MSYEINTVRGISPVLVVAKEMKSVRLKVFPSGEIRLSVPTNTPEEFIRNFLSDKRQWIDKQLQRFKETEAVEKEDTIRTGTSTRILGRQLAIKIVEARQKRIIRDDLKLFIYTPNVDDQDDIDRQFMNWWQKNSKQYFQEQLDRLFPIVEKHGVAKPELVVKRMQTLWGSCSRKNGIVNLNYYLYKAPVPCIEYVILHELIHFLYPRHDKNFHDFLTIYMPDWDERKHLLDFEIVLGV